MINKSKDDTIKNDWENRPVWNKGEFNQNLQRLKKTIIDKNYIPGADFDIRLDDITINKIIQFKGLDQTPQGNDPGKVYYDKVNKKLLMWVDSVGKWVEILYTSTSTSTTSTSTSSTSTSTT